MAVVRILMSQDLTQLLALQGFSATHFYVTHLYVRGACSIVDASFLCLSLRLTHTKSLIIAIYFFIYNLYERSCVTIVVLSCFLAITLFFYEVNYFYSPLILYK